MSDLRVLVEVDGEKILDYSEAVEDVHVSHSQGVREKVMPLESVFQEYERDGTHHVVLSYKEGIK